jgi:signal transduction histidine kinase
MVAVLGANAGLVAAAVPEFATLLAVPPDPGDPLTAEVRAQRSSLEILRAVASPERPVVVFVDDLQWAGRTAAGLVDLLLIAAQLTVSLDNAQLYAELTASRARIVTAADQARRRIERDLHDGAQQRLVALPIQARVAQKAVPPGSGKLAARLDVLATGGEPGRRGVARTRPGHSPGGSRRRRPAAALRALARRSPVPVRLQVGVEGRLPEQVEIATSFTVAEALTNAAKHAQAAAVTVTVAAVDGVLQVRVSDNGRGGADPGSGSGLLGLKDRVNALGGRLSVQNGPDAGTIVDSELPLTPPHTVPS